MKSIKVNYFALLREKAGKTSEDLSFEGTLEELYRQLSLKYHFDLPVEMVQVAVNDEFSRMDAEVEMGSKIVFIPPMAGG